MNARKALKHLATGAAIAALLGTVALTPAQAELKKGGQLRYAYPSGPGTLDPFVSSSAVELEVIQHLYDALITVGEKYETRPMIATSYEIADNARTFTFKIRKDVKFHDGTPLTSADVLASFERYKKVSTNAVIFADVASATAPDPETFIIKLNKTNSAFIDTLKAPVYPFVILPASQKDKPARGIDIIGTGPYKLKEWAKDSHLVLERFPGYVPNPAYKGTDGYAGSKVAYLDAITYRFIPEANGRVAALQSDDADVVANIPVDLAKRFEGDKRLVVQRVEPYCMQVLIVNSSQGATANAKVRQAINAAVDVDEITMATGDVAKKNPSLTYDFSPWYQGAKMKAYYDQKSPAKAAALLKEAGYKGETITLQSTAQYPNYRTTMVVLAELLKAAGMTVKVDLVDWTTNASNMQRGTGTWNVSTTSFCSDPLLGPQKWRTQLYTFPQVKNDTVMDAAYERFFTSTDDDVRKKAWYEIENQVLSQAYVIKIADLASTNAYNKRVEGFTPFILPRFWNVGLN
ncbi:MAG: hypothetical protein J7549_03120 [Variovorax sp.]|nr:hypothetical protein [Variovorax sp.]